MAYNKFIKKDGEVLLDLTRDTVAAETMLKGIMAHNKHGEGVTGEIETILPENLVSDGLSVTIPNGYIESEMTYQVAEDLDTTITEQENLLASTMELLESKVTEIELDHDEHGAYLIQSVDDLNLFANYVNNGTHFYGQTIKLTTDLVVNPGDYTTWTSSSSLIQHTPIGIWGFAFRGTFDGQGHKISGLYYNGDADNVGFFGTLSDNAIVKYLILDNVSFTTTSANVGGVCSTVRYGMATIEKCYVRGKLQSTGQAGGIIGALWNNDAGAAVVRECVVEGEIKCTGHYSGGIVGLQGSGETSIYMTDCLNLANVTGASYAGGLVGGFQWTQLGQKLVITTSIGRGTATTTRTDADTDGSIIGNVPDDHSFSYILYDTKNAATGIPRISKTYAVRDVVDEFGDHEVDADYNLLENPTFRDGLWALEYVDTDASGYVNPSTFNYMSAYFPVSLHTKEGWAYSGDGWYNLYTPNSACVWTNDDRTYCTIAKDFSQLHPGSKSGPVLTYVAPASGTISFYASISPYGDGNVSTSADGGNSIYLYVNNTKVWPATEAAAVAYYDKNPRANPFKVDVQSLQVNKGDKIRLVLICKPGVSKGGKGCGMVDFPVVTWQSTSDGTPLDGTTSYVATRSAAGYGSEEAYPGFTGYTTEDFDTMATRVLISNGLRNWIQTTKGPLPKQVAAMLGL